ncbi:MAG: CPBP family intramembrane metalloprotease [Candidatus Krumholzibacteria bacterium]|nr:CPBP family intramembrane metalloprotease [Candidatus Krumholzibacteria bacterium]
MNARAQRLTWPIVGTVAVVVLSFVFAVWTGTDVASLIVLVSVLIVCWAVTRLSRRGMGLRWGAASHYGVALAYPCLMAALVGGAAWVTGNVVLNDAAPATVGKTLLLMFVSTMIGVLITEEGFFRGWLWGSLERSRLSPKFVLIWTAVAFTLWHVPAATVEPNFSLPPAIVPVYLANVLILGLIWGILRAVSGSVIVPTFCHSVWNALTYVFFGYGIKTKALGITAYNMFDLERGYVGLILNAIALVLFWCWWRRKITAGLPPTTS